ncbi:hypothetical protein IMZ11_08630 [Microtetraspora sp. AC03309]|uniref:hypothetical protein n=1 Tax=Microtetraspora sp. AC03309 TaxID=2779376 RepID=UPI001E6344FF|nr:hypothetical protein [Microtetraspora sp. AC03309]MCC5575706.1 hypothetical protein [Microtetraspora sp. AC03309]
MIGAGAALTLSALRVPAAWPFVAKLYIHQYDPKAFWDGAEVWREVVSEVRTARERIIDLVSGVSDDDWKSEDGRAFQHGMDAFLEELASIEIRAAVVAVVLYMAAVATYAMVLLARLVALTLAAVAAWVLLASVTPPSAVNARLIAVKALHGMHGGFVAVESGLEVLLHTCAGLLGAAVAGDIFVRSARGDHSAVTDFVQATISQGPLLIWGTANRVERDLTAHGISGKFPGDGFLKNPFGPRAGMPLTPGLPQAAGAKGVNDIAGNRQTITGPYAPEQNADGSYKYPWE